MNIDDAFKIMRNEGYCLWIGAGVTKHLAGPSSYQPFLWEDLVIKLEEEAEIIFSGKGDFTKRLDAVFDKLGNERCSKKIRKLVVDPLVLAIIEMADKHIEEHTMDSSHEGEVNVVPKAIVQLSALGSLANPIVNFNIETFSSIAVATATSNFQLNVFEPASKQNREETRDRLIEGIYGKKIFARHIHHPHGAINAHGRKILTFRDYRKLHRTLALEVGVHSAFYSNLVIVGKSLDDNDKYLKETIVKYRHQINSIIWFTDKNDSETKKWACDNDIMHIVVNKYETFWNFVQDNLPIPEYGNLLRAWQFLLQESLNFSVCLNPISYCIKAMQETGNLSPLQLEKLRQASLHRGEEDAFLISRKDERERKIKYDIYFRNFGTNLLGCLCQEDNEGRSGQPM